MNPENQFILDINEELIVDNFAGGGGASTGIERALGRHVDHAINHDEFALGMHRINHPPVAEALVRANSGDLRLSEVLKRRAENPQTKIPVMAL